MKISWKLVTLLLMSMSLAACAGFSFSDSNENPAAIAFVSGSDFLRVTLTEREVERIGIQTAQVEDVPEGLLPYELFDYGNFSDPTNIKNEWFPLIPGNQWIHEGFTHEEEDGMIPHRIEFTVTDLVKTIDGIPAIVAWIVDISDGEIVEKEIAFFAEDDNHTIWLLGEHPEEFEDGEFQLAPTWIAGRQGAKAGIAMRANHQEGSPDYAQGWAPAVNWTDRARVSQMGQTATVAAGTFDELLIMEEFNLTEPDIITKSYAKGVGLVEVGWRGELLDGSESLELVELNQIATDTLAAIDEEALALDENAYSVSADAYSQTAPARLRRNATQDGAASQLGVAKAFPLTAIPEGAVIYGLHGETWLYERLEASSTYERRPITIEDIKDGLAILSEGPPVGAEIVTVGSMALHNQEIGGSR